MNGVNKFLVGKFLAFTIIIFVQLNIFAQSPTITSIVATAIPNITTANNSGYFGQVETINGSNFLSSGMTVAIDNVSVPYTFVNSGQIKVTVPGNIVSDYLIVTNTSTSAFAKVNFQINGFISTQAGDWSVASTWLGGVIPTFNSTVTVNNAVIISTEVTVAPDYVTVSSAGSISLNPGINPDANLTVGLKLLNNNSISMANNTSITLKVGAILDNGSGSFTSAGNSLVFFSGSGSVSGTITFNNLTINGSIAFNNAVTISGTLLLNAGGAVTGNAPTYLTNSKLTYNTGAVTVAPGVEWSSATPGTAGYPYNVDIGQNTVGNVDISLGTIPTAIGGVLQINDGSLTMNNRTQSLTVTGDLLVMPNGSLSLSTKPGGDLILKSDFDNEGTFTANVGQVTFNSKTKNQYLYAQVPTTLYTLNVDKSAYTFYLANSPSGNKIFNFNNQINVTSGTLDVNSMNMVLKSNATNTASITKISGSIINATNVTAERYFPAHRCWRLVSVPISSSQTINASWQEGQTNTTLGTNNNSIPGYGTHISGAQPGKGFDFTNNNNPSMLQYVPLTDSWVTVPNTNSTNVCSQSAYFLFVRGSRAVNLANNSYATADATVLRENGTLRQGDQVINVPSSASGNFVLVGNPYPCAIDFNLLTRSSGLGNNFRVWDPSLTGTYGVGAYVTFTWNGSGYSYAPTPATAQLGQYIQSGQAFIVQTASTAQTITISESSKVSGSNSNVFKAEGSNIQEIRINLNIKNPDNSYTLEDGTLAIFGEAFSNGMDNTDAIKANNFRESVFLMRDTNLLAIEARKPIILNDTLFLNCNTYLRSYNFEISANNMNDPALTASLIDKYTNTETILNLNNKTIYNFSVTNDLGSQASDRFKIVFKKLATLPVSFISISAQQTKDIINVEWKTENQHNIKNYEVQRSAFGNSFDSIASVNIKEGTSLTFDYLDKQPLESSNYYRIKSIGFAGDESYSKIVKVDFNKTISDFVKVFPNPVVNGNINIQFSSFDNGIYQISLVNQVGQIVYSTSISKNKGIGGIVSFHCNINHGKYELKILKPNGEIIPSSFISL